MTDRAQQLLSLGAEAVGGFVYLNRVLVGAYRNDGFELTEAGHAALDAVEFAPADPVPVEPEAPAPAEPVKRRAKKADKPVEPEAPAPQPASDPISLDDLLGE